MLEALAAMCRTLACDTKLLILYHLAREGELPAAEIARRAFITPQLASIHLRQLMAMHLLARRRSAARVYYRLAADDAASGLPGILNSLRRALDHATRPDLGGHEPPIRHLAPATARKVQANVARALDAIFDASSAFANVRRLQILGLLRRKGRCDLSTVVGELRMSPPACLRHMDKLRRRGYVRHEGSGAWSLLMKGHSTFHSELLGLIVPHVVG